VDAPARSRRIFFSVDGRRFDSSPQIDFRSRNWLRFAHSMRALDWRTAEGDVTIKTRLRLRLWLLVGAWGGS
jgi:hypothetical protein